MNWFSETSYSRYKAQYQQTSGSITCWLAVLICFLIALEIAIFGFVPGIENPETALAISWSLLIAAWILMLFSFVSGFAYDIQQSTIR